MLLVNCLDREVYVCAQGHAVALPRRPVPRVLHPTSQQARDIDVPTEHGSARVSLVAPGPAAFSLHSPPEAPRTLYLVEPEVMAAFPDRTDFVVPYRWARSSDPAGPPLTLRAVTASLVQAYDGTMDMTDEVAQHATG